MIELPLSCATVPQIIQLGFSDCNEIEKPAQHVGWNACRCHFPPERRQVTFNISDTLIKIANRMALSASREADLPLTDIFDYLRFHPHPKLRDQWWLYTKLHGRLAAPWTCLVVVLIALPFGAASGRRNVFVGVASSIGIAFAFLLLMRVSLLLGMNGLLPAWLAGWLPNLIFGFTGLWLTARTR